MDKNTVIGFVLIAAIIVGFSILSRPSDEEIARRQRYNDSIALVQLQQQNKIAAEQAINETSIASANTEILQTNDSSQAESLLAIYGEFGKSAIGEEQFYTLENEHLKLTFASKGGRIYTADLKNYRTHDSLPLILFDAEESNMAFTLVTNNNRVLNSSEMYFEKVEAPTTDSDGNSFLTLRLNTYSGAYIDFIYTLPKDDFMLDFRIKANGMEKVMPGNTNFLEMSWVSKIRQQEKGRKFEDRYSQIHYKFTADDVEKMSESKNDSERLSNKVKWIAFKDQFFSSVLIAENSFSSTHLVSTLENEKSNYLKAYTANMIIDFDPRGQVSSDFKMYLGPNQYKILNEYDKGVPSEDKLYLRKLIPLGWGIFGWVNRFLIIPLFNLFNLFIGNYGIIIFLMTIVIKIIIFPMTYKSYISSARMRVLKPEIDEINARIPAEKAAERQKATMELYSKVGVSPMSGCLPMLLQMPILIAMFSFFPASIELRQESFLWAKDLSSYDAIISWDAYIPLITPYFGNHISLFCLLMTITTLLYNRLNMATQPANDQPGMGMMKWMMYLMPVMFLFIFNNYASGLSYYYFLSTLFSVAQTYIFRATINEEKLLATLHAKRNNKSPKKKTGFMERLEKMQREQEKAMKNRKR